MLEIAILCSCAARLGQLARDKGRRAGWYQFLLVVSWFVAEFLGLAAGAVLERSLRVGEPVLKYVVGLASAALAAWLVFQYVGSLRSLPDPAAAPDGATTDAMTAGATMPPPPDDGNPYRAPS